ncbi:hypothetical protein E0493_11880 [Roseomonas sp. M0104]|uniref:Uncharacterized protein n=1 Tax=Teichococcus coralli TaxID=2545983 RepID=A0A845B8W2_9PROT|nr:hypothetical protein [Pseudoroseomonas coralli]MXP64043.1 hypothetical protein [Pseudoroseomonas coralli]
MPAEAATLSPKAKRQPMPLNGVNTPALLATIGAVATQPALAAIVAQSRARSAVFDILTHGVPVSITVQD